MTETMLRYFARHEYLVVTKEYTDLSPLEDLELKFLSKLIDNYLKASFPDLGAN